MHEGRALSHQQYWQLVTQGLASRVMFSPTRTPSGHDLKAHAPGERHEFSRASWRRMTMPWRRDKVN